MEHQKVKFKKKKVRVGKTQYKYVSEYLYDDETMYLASITSLKWLKVCKDIRDAAKCVDLKLIEVGKQPVNILKRVEA
jgi:hypothetical protein